MTSTLIKSYTAAAAIAACRLLVVAAGPNVAQAAGATAPIIGVSEKTGAAAGEFADCIHAGVVLVEAGAAFAVGAAVTSDAQGRGVGAAPAAGANAWVAGIALDAALAAGDRVRVLLMPHRLQG